MQHREQLLRSVKQLKQQCHVLSGIINGDIVSRTSIRDVEKGISRVVTHQDSSRIIQAIKLHLVLSDRLNMFEDELHMTHGMSMEKIMAYGNPEIVEENDTEASGHFAQNEEDDGDNYEEEEGYDEDEDDDDNDEYYEQGTEEEKAKKLLQKHMGIYPPRKKLRIIRH